MSYGFTFEQSDGVERAYFQMNSAEMSMMREFMREVGAAAQAGQKRSLNGPAPDAQSVPLSKFLSNDDWHVTSQECRTIASRLRAGKNTIRELASFFDDAPPWKELERWLESWIDYNERAAEHGGYRVS